MNKILRLAATLRKCGNGSAEKKYGNSAETITSLTIAAIFAIALFFFGRSLNQLSAYLGDPRFILKALFMLGSVVSLFFVFPSVVNQLYMSGDLPLLLTMPYRPSEIVLARLINLIRLPALFCITASLPAVIGYSAASFSWEIILAGFLSALLSPLIVLSFAGIVTVVIMTCVNGVRNKDFLKSAGIILAFILLMLFLFFTNSGQGMTRDDMFRLAVVFGRFSNLLPINFALGQLMNGFSFPALLETLGITVAFVLVFWLLVSRLYLIGALSMQETASGNGLLGKDGVRKNSRKQTILRSLTLKELKSVSREPAYLMNGFLYTLFFPLLMVLTTGFAGARGLGASLNSLSSPATVTAFILQNACLLTFAASSTNTIAASPISREGKSFGILKTLPLDHRIILRAKRNAALLVCALGSTLYLVIGGLILVFMGYLPVWGIFYGLALNVPLLIFTVDMNMLHDLKKPDLNWESEAQMLKNRCGVMSALILIIGMILPIFIAVFLPVLCSIYPISWLLFMAGSLLIALLLGVLTDRRLMKKGLELLQKM